MYTLRAWFSHGDSALRCSIDIHNDVQQKSEFVPYNGDNKKYAHFRGRLVVVTEHIDLVRKVLNIMFKHSVCVEFLSDDIKDFVDVTNPGVHPELIPYYHLANTPDNCADFSHRMAITPLYLRSWCNKFVSCGPGQKCLEESGKVPCKACLFWSGYCIEEWDTLNNTLELLRKADEEKKKAKNTHQNTHPSTD